jgi:hypothetical protein
VTREQKAGNAVQGNRLLGREPVVTVSTVVAALIAILPIFGWSTEVVGTVAAALVVLGGAVEAALVSVDRVLPLLVGIAKAVLSVLAAFSVHLPDNYVSAIMALLTVIAGLAVRQQVSPAVPPKLNYGWQGGVYGYSGLERDAPPIPDRGVGDGRDFVSEQRPPLSSSSPAVAQDREQHYGGKHEATDLWPSGFGDLGPSLG